MHLLELHYRAYGCFTDLRLDLSGAGRQLHVVYGPNEAGKSTALRGLCDFLFGIPARTTDNFVHKNADLRISARLADDDWAVLEVVRRKGNRDTLADVAGHTVPESQLTRLVGGLPREQFETLFRIDHTALVEGGQALLDGRGEMAASLFQSGAGVVGVRQVLQTLDAEAEALFKPRGSNAPLNESLSRFKDKKKLAQERSLPAAEWKRLSRELDDQTERLLGLRQQHQDKAAQLERLRRVRQALPLVTRRLEIARRQEALRGTPQVSTADSQLCERLIQQRVAANEQNGRSQQAEQSITNELAGLPSPTSVLSRSGEIAAIIQRVDGFRQASRDLPLRRGERHRLEAESREKLGSVRPDLSLERAASVRLKPSDRTRVRRLADEFTKLQTLLSTASERIEALEAACRRHQQSRSQETPPDGTQLVRTLLSVRDSGNLASQLEAERQACEILGQRIDVDLARFSLWRGSPAELELLPVPSVEVVEAFVAEVAGLESRRAQIQRQSDEARGQRERIVRDMQAHIESGGVPTEQELLAARTRRDHGWNLVRQAWLEGAGPDQAAQEREFAGDLPLDQAFAVSVADADKLADRLRREAERVARLAELRADLDRIARQVAHLAETETALEHDDSSQKERWRALWRTCGIVPENPTVMRAWLSRQMQLATQCRELRERSQGCQQLAERHASQVALLRDALEGLAVTVPQGTPWDVLLRIADEAVAHHEAARKQHEQAQGESQRLAAELDQARDERDRLQKKFEKWRDDWRVATSGVAAGPHDTHRGDGVEETLATLEAIDEVCQNLGKIGELDQRINEMQSYVDGFIADVTPLIDAIDPELARLTADGAANDLHQRLSAAQEAEGRRVALLRQLDAERESLRRADSVIAANSTAIAELLDRFRCADLAEFQTVEQQARHVQALAEEQAKIERDLSGFAAGAELGQFLSEVAGRDVDRLPVEIQELETQIGLLDVERAACQETVGRLRSEQSRHDGTGEAVEAAQEAQEALAAARAQAEDYVRLRLAAGLLRRHLERYRQQSQDPVLRRAGELFSRLTALSFVSVEADFDDDDRPILVGVRSSGGRLRVEGMSDGTRDQLFLALRLASLERQLDGLARIPLVVDDILINFDDERSRATLEVLAEFSRLTQVLFFTHHHRLLDLAVEVVPAERLAIHRLERYRS